MPGGWFVLATPKLWPREVVGGNVGESRGRAQKTAPRLCAVSQSTLRAYRVSRITLKLTESEGAYS